MLTVCRIRAQISGSQRPVLKGEFTNFGRFGDQTRAAAILASIDRSNDGRLSSRRASNAAQKPEDHLQ
jgi:hypothetical protein